MDNETELMKKRITLQVIAINVVDDKIKFLRHKIPLDYNDFSILIFGKNTDNNNSFTTESRTIINGYTDTDSVIEILNKAILTIKSREMGEL